VLSAGNPGAFHGAARADRRRALMTASSPTTAALARPATSRAWGAVAREVASDRTDRAVFLATVALVGFGYSLLLPFAYTQRISFANWRYLDARYLAFSVAFALGIASLLTLQIHAVRRVARAAARERGAGSTGPLGVLAGVISVMPSLLCCSPLLPTVIGVLGLSATTRLDTTVQLQHFFATKENLLLGGALALLLCSGLWSMSKLARASCLEDEGCPAPTTDQGADARPALARDGRMDNLVVVDARADGASEAER
jgi:hypothetical protein